MLQQWQQQQQPLIIIVALLLLVSSIHGYKEDICTPDYDISNAATNLIRVSDESATYPRVLCIVNTISTHHDTLVKAIKHTWGTKCDGIFFGSNKTDASLPSMKFDVPSDHNHLWQKHKATLRHVYDNYRHDYDWFYKCDDDAFVIIENLKKYLRSPEIENRVQLEPLNLGHRFKLTQKLLNYYVVDKTLLQQYKDKFNSTWVFNSGGPGYAMNYVYLKTVVESFDNWNCLSDKYSEMLPDDAAITFCSAWHGGHPIDTRDIDGRQRWHADKPRGVYWTKPEQPDYWFIQYHEDIGGYQWKKECCSRFSIAFHYITENMMYWLARKFYYCQNDAIKTLEEVKKIHGMTLPDTIFPEPKDKK